MNNAYSISTWCERKGISRSSYYELKKKGLAPAEIRVGTKPLILDKADEDWDKMMSKRAAAEQSTRETEAV